MPRTRKQESTAARVEKITTETEPETLPNQKLKKTRSQSQNAFPDGIGHVQRIPTTSTPKVDLRNKKITKRDVDTAFGFDDSIEAEANYSTVISPIAHAVSKPGTHTPVWKVSPLTQRNVELETPGPVVPPTRTREKASSRFSALLDQYKEEEPIAEFHVDPKKILRTYGSRKRVRIQEDREEECDYEFTKNVRVEYEENQKRSKKSKKKATSQQKQDNEDNFDVETERWLKEKNREFEDIQKAPLVIENSFSD